MSNIQSRIVSSSLFSIPRRMIWKAIQAGVSRKGGVILYLKRTDPAVDEDVIYQVIRNAKLLNIAYSYPHRRNVLDLIRKIMKEDIVLQGLDEAYRIYHHVKQADKIEGDLAEVGVAKGGSAKIIAEAKGTRPLHLFDAFDTGLPKPGSLDTMFYEGQFVTPSQEVKKLLSPYPNVHLYKGFFPDTAQPLINKKFSFVHLDVDLVQSSQDCLEFFYPRMSKGGIILCQDYNIAPVRELYEEFFKDKPEPIIELTTNQCVIVKG